MADKSSPLVLDALGRAAAEPLGIPLFTSKKRAGLFAGNAAGKLAAQQAKDAGLVRVLHTETAGKSSTEICTITEKGLAHLLSQLSPRQVLEDFVRAVEARQQEVVSLLDSARKLQSSLEGLKTSVGKVLQQVQQPPEKAASVPAQVNGSASWKPFLLSFLGQWQTSGVSEDCAIPDLYRKARAKAPTLSIGAFHDGLRSLHEQEQIYLHPWTGPLYDIPDPSYALLVGHEVAYYVSLRENAAN